MDEQRLIEKLRRIEALFAGSDSAGERAAAEDALRRILGRLADSVAIDPPVEYKFTLADSWSRRLFVALLRRYGIKPYRRYRQRHTTVMAQVPARFVDETLWPQYIELNKTLRSYLDEVTQRVIREAVHADTSEAAEEPAQIEGR